MYFVEHEIILENSFISPKHSVTDGWSVVRMLATGWVCSHSHNPYCPSHLTWMSFGGTLTCNADIVWQKDGPWKNPSVRFFQDPFLKLSRHSSNEDRITAIGVVLVSTLYAYHKYYILIINTTECFNIANKCNEFVISILLYIGFWSEWQNDSSVHRCVIITR